MAEVHIIDKISKDIDELASLSSFAANPEDYLLDLREFESISKKFFKLFPKGEMPSDKRKHVKFLRSWLSEHAKELRKEEGQRKKYVLDVEELEQFADYISKILFFADIVVPYFVEIFGELKSDIDNKIKVLRKNIDYFTLEDSDLTSVDKLKAEDEELKVNIGQPKMMKGVKPAVRDLAKFIKKTFLLIGESFPILRQIAGMKPMELPLSVFKGDGFKNLFDNIKDQIDMVDIGDLMLELNKRNRLVQRLFKNIARLKQSIPRDISGPEHIEMLQKYDDLLNSISQYPFLPQSIQDALKSVGLDKIERAKRFSVKTLRDDRQMDDLKRLRMLQQKRKEVDEEARGFGPSILTPLGGAATSNQVAMLERLHKERGLSFDPGYFREMPAEEARDMIAAMTFGDKSLLPKAPRGIGRKPPHDEKVLPFELEIVDEDAPLRPLTPPAPSMRGEPVSEEEKRRLLGEEYDEFFGG